LRTVARGGKLEGTLQAASEPRPAHCPPFSIADHRSSSIEGPTLGVPGQPLTYTFAVSGPTQGIVFNTNYGDGTRLTTSAGGPSTELDHLYTAPGTFTIKGRAR
jgi:hypothetical protein